MLDFKLLSFGRVATEAINLFLDLHPEISLPNYDKVFAAFSARNGGVPLLKFTPEKPLRGLIIHSAQFLDSNSGVNNLVSARAADLPSCKTLHIVRNPYDNALSWLNLCNASAIAKVSRLNTFHHSVESFFNTYPNDLLSLKYGLQADTFYNNGDEHMLLNFESLLPEKISQTMREIFAFLEVDKDFTSPAFFEIQNNITTRLLAKGVKLAINNETVSVTFRPISLLEKHQAFEAKSVIQTPQLIFRTHCPSLTTVNEPLLMMIDAQDDLKYKFERHIAERTGSDFDAKNVLEIWAKANETIGHKIKMAHISELSQSDRDFVKAAIMHDYQNFFDKFPELRSKWAL